MRDLSEAEMGIVAGGNTLGDAIKAAEHVCGRGNVKSVSVGADGSVTIVCKDDTQSQS